MNKFIKTLKESELLGFLQQECQQKRIVTVRISPRPTGEMVWVAKSSERLSRGKLKLPDNNRKGIVKNLK